MTEAVSAIVVAGLVVYVWMIQPLRRFRRRGGETRLPDPWVT